jgi:hypothetical protein
VDATDFEVAALRPRLNRLNAFPDDQPLLEEGMIVTTIHQSKPPPSPLACAVTAWSRPSASMAR